MHDEAQRRDQLSATAKHAISQLETLVAASRQQLADAEAIPNAYATLADDLSKELIAARELADSVQPGEPLIARLWPLLDIGDQLQMQLAERWRIWQQFVRDRDAANAKLDTLHGLLNKITDNKRQPIDAVQCEVEKLKVLALNT